MNARRLTKGTRVEISTRHFGCGGRRGIVTGATHTYRGVTYYAVRLRDEAGDRWTIRFPQGELKVIQSTRRDRDEVRRSLGLKRTPYGWE